MDNDIQLIKTIKRVVKRIKFQYDYRNVRILPAEEGNQRIATIVSSGKPFAAIRGGATEMRCIAEYLKTGEFSEKIQKEISELSGVFPTTRENLERFCKYYVACIKQADMLALWGVGAESVVVKGLDKKHVAYVELEALEPYYFENPWSAVLKGKRILVVHPFKSSIQSQYARRKKIFENQQILPEFQSLECIQAVQSIAGEKTQFDTWFDALEHMKREIQKCEFDVAIIGAGAYSLPLATYVKQLGKAAIQMSGATQILFGIKGKRWEQIPAVSRLFNENWVRPNESETPEGSKKVEGGSYW